VFRLMNSCAVSHALPRPHRLHMWVSRRYFQSYRQVGKGGSLTLDTQSWFPFTAWLVTLGSSADVPTFHQ
jgi:hypothetical protein